MSRYSIDFRKKIIEAYEEGGTSIRKVAQQFRISPNTVMRLLKQYRQTGDLSAKKCGTRKKSILSHYAEAVIEMVKAHPDLTLWQYCEKLREEQGVQVSNSMMARFLKQHNFTLKKKHTGARRW